MTLLIIFSISVVITNILWAGLTYFLVWNMLGKPKVFKLGKKPILLEDVEEANDDEILNVIHNIRERESFNNNLEQIPDVDEGEVE